MRVWLSPSSAVVIAAATIVTSIACSDSSARPPVAAGTVGGIGAVGSGGGTGSDVDGGITADGGLCLGGTYDIDLDTALGDVNEVAGTINFSTTVAAGHSIALTITSTTGTPTFTNTFTFTVPKDEFTYRLRSLPAATYTLQAQADVAGTTSVNDVGDLDGYFGGGTLSPIHTRADSTTITLPQCLSGADFGIGPKM